MIGQDQLPAKFKLNSVLPTAVGPRRTTNTFFIFERIIQTDDMGQKQEPVPAGQNMTAPDLHNSYPFLLQGQTDSTSVRYSLFLSLKVRVSCTYVCATEKTSVIL